MCFRLYPIRFGCNWIACGFDCALRSGILADVCLIVWNLFCCLLVFFSLLIWLFYFVDLFILVYLV